MDYIRTLLVDDSLEFLEAAIHFLASDPNIKIVGSSVSGYDALEQVKVLKPDLVLMDLALPGMNGLETTKQIKSEENPPLVIILTLHENDEYRVASQSAHADGFVAKSEFGVDLLPLIQYLFEENALVENPF
jgi:DNA-binding NarL/FixJ family response regulator